MHSPTAFHSIQMVIITVSTRAVCWSLPTETCASANNRHRRMVMLQLSCRAIIGIDYLSDGTATVHGRNVRKSNDANTVLNSWQDFVTNEIFTTRRVTRTVEGALRERPWTTHRQIPHTRAYRSYIMCIKPYANTETSAKQLQRTNSKRICFSIFSFILFLANVINEKMIMWKNNPV